jgi:autotransporter-associated beta strand protein
MKTIPLIHHRLLTLPLLFLVLAAAPQANAQFYFWNTGVTNGQWSDPASWIDETVPNEAGDVVFFENTTSTLVGLEDYTATAGELLFSGPTVLGSTATTNDILNLAMPDESQPVIEVGTSAATVFMYADLASTNGFQKTGPGKLTFRFNGADQNYTGNVVIGSGILGINQNGSLGASNNGIIISNGARLLAEPAANTGTITIPAERSITVVGAQSQFGASPAAVNLVIEGSIGEDAAGRGFVKTDGGTVTLLGNLGYSGETRIAGGALVLGGTAALPPTNLRFNGATGTLDVGAANQAARVIVWDNTAGNKTITGSGGGLTLSGEANQGFTTAINGVVYDLSGLSSFNYNPLNNANREFGASAGGGSATNINVTNTVNFSRTANDITAQFIRLGGGAFNAAGLWTVMKFGQTNNLNAGGDILLGNFQGNADISFYPDLTNAVFRVRGAEGGETPVPLFRIANTVSGGQPTTAIVDLTGGSLDVVATTMDVGSTFTGGSWTASTAVLTMPDGNVVAETLSLARVGPNHSVGTPNIRGTLNQLGGLVTANTVVLGYQQGISASQPTLVANYNLNGGALVAGAITTIGANVGLTNAIPTERNLNLNGGTLRNKPGENLSVNGLDADDPFNRLNVVVGEAGGTVEAGAENAITLGSGALVSGPGNLSKTGAGTLVLAGPAAHLGDTVVSAGALELGATGSLAFTIGGNGTNNALSGTGTALLDGTLLFDLEGASTTDGDSWNVIASSVGKTYGPGFLVGGFDGAGGTWTLATNGVTYQFVESTGVLSVSGDAPVDNYAAWVGYWQTASGGTFTDTAGDADPDGDGFDNNMEFAFDGNPTVGTPALLTATKSGADAVFNFVARKDPPGGATYQVQSTADLAVGPWTNSAVTVSNSLNQTGILVPAEYERREFTVPASSKNFYRVQGTITD